jgi:predicted enzyme related to lactoylglutathione lyase
MTQTLRGLATVNFYAANHQEAVKWYSDFLKMEPYFNVPGYSEFRIGDYQSELGIIDSKYAPKNIGDKPAGATIYWHVDNLEATVNRLVSLGAAIHDPITARGNNGFVTASVIDPFGNILGVMTNPHYLEILTAESTSK